MNMLEYLLIILVSGASLVLALWGILQSFRRREWLVSVILLALIIAGILILFFRPMLNIHSGAILLATSAAQLVHSALKLKNGKLPVAKFLLPLLLMMTCGQALEVTGIKFSPWITLALAFLLYFWIQFERRLNDGELLMESSILLLVLAFVMI
jgi:hypothetical protein